MTKLDEYNSESIELLIKLFERKLKINCSYSDQKIKEIIDKEILGTPPAKGTNTDIAQHDYEDIYLNVKLHIKDNSIPIDLHDMDKDVKDWIKRQKIKDKQSLKIDDRGELLKLNNYVLNVDNFYMKHPFFYDMTKQFWIWNETEYRYDVTDDTQLLNAIEDKLGLYGDLVTSQVKSAYTQALKSVGRRNIPKEAPTEWIQFKDDVYDFKSQQFFKATPNYFFTNPIPWALGKTTDTPMIDKLFTDWVDERSIPTLYEMLAYCLYRAYPIHRIFFLLGTGSNGKGTYTKILKKFLGQTNTCSTTLRLLIERPFETVKLDKKLACIMGETNLDIISETDLLKKLSGEDLIGMEQKGCKGYDSINYAKIIILSNGLPISEDTSDGFYRRCQIINFINQYKDGKDVSLMIPDEEYQNLALKLLQVLQQLLINGTFTSQGDIKDRKLAYQEASNPFPSFVKQYCELDLKANVAYGKLYGEYVRYLEKHKKRPVSYRAFGDSLIMMGLEKCKTSVYVGDEKVSGWFVFGISLKKPMTEMTEMTHSPVNFTIYENQLDTESSQSSGASFWSDRAITWRKCAFEGCETVRCNLSSSGRPFCAKHWPEN